MFSISSNTFPDGTLTCYDDKGFELEKEKEEELLSPGTTKLKENVEEEEKLFSPGTICVFLSTGHISSGGFAIEMFCQESHWKVSLTQL